MPSIDLPVHSQSAQSVPVNAAVVNQSQSPSNTTRSTSTIGKVPLKKFGSGISIKAALSGIPSANVSNSSSEVSTNTVREDDGIDLSWNSPVSEESLRSEWVNYANKIQKQNSRLYSILNNHKPLLADNMVVKVGLKNENQIAELNKEKSNLFMYLKKQLRNAKLSLETHMVLEDDGVQKAFTTSDKLKLMLEKNPLLIELKNTFDLDLD